LEFYDEKPTKKFSENIKCTNLFFLNKKKYCTKKETEKKAIILIRKKKNIPRLIIEKFKKKNLRYIESRSIKKKKRRITYKSKYFLKRRQLIIFKFNSFFLNSLTIEETRTQKKRKQTSTRQPHFPSSQLNSHLSSPYPILVDNYIFDSMVFFLPLA